MAQSRLSIRIDENTKKEADTLAGAAKKAVRRAIRETRAKGQPVALYDAKRKRPYLEYSDGRKEYEFND